MIGWLKSLLGSGLSPEETAIKERYLETRAASRHLNLRLIKALPSVALPECAKKLGLSKAGTLIINQDDEIAIAYDYCLHHYRRAGKNALDRALDAPPEAPSALEASILSAMQTAQFSLFRITAIRPHQGATLEDLITHQSLSLMDLGLSSAGLPGVIVAGRILDFGEFRMSAGTLIPVPEEIYEGRIRQVVEKFYGEVSQGTRLSQAQSAAFEAQVLRIALSEGGEDNSFYTDIDA